VLFDSANHVFLPSIEKRCVAFAFELSQNAFSKHFEFASRKYFRVPLRRCVLLKRDALKKQKKLPSPKLRRDKLQLFRTFRTEGVLL